MTKHFRSSNNYSNLGEKKASPLLRKSKHNTLEVCLSISLTTLLAVPNEYMIISPICFVSCKHTRKINSKFSLRIPHAVKDVMNMKKENFKILSMTTYTIGNNMSVESPIAEYPPSMNFAEIDVDSMDVYQSDIKFRYTISNPSLYAVALKNQPQSFIPRPIPTLRCILFCVYHSYDEHTNISVIPIKIYVGMGIKSVQKVHHYSRTSLYYIVNMIACFLLL